MATKKKPAKAVKKSAPAKKTAVKKAVPAKKTVKKAAPVKKAAAPVKKAAKKAVPAKKPAPVAKKPIAAPAKKAAPAAAVKHVAKPVAEVPVKKVPTASMPKLPSKQPVVPAALASKPIVGAPKPGVVPAHMVKKQTPPPPTRPTKVVVPEMKSKSARTYQPDFTKSVLDTPIQQQTGPTMRYSDADLGEFRDLINKKLDAAKKELAYLQGLITRKDEMGGDESESRYMTMEDGSVSMEREQLAQMASRQITFIDHLEKAIMRIENKTYGICRVTGKLIDKARLRAVPHATLSIEAKQLMNK
jgi:RNA polymerase-binding transcription factor DksA